MVRPWKAPFRRDHPVRPVRGASLKAALDRLGAVLQKKHPRPAARLQQVEEPLGERDLRAVAKKFDTMPRVASWRGDRRA
jgi:hypothetical protein